MACGDMKQVARIATILTDEFAVSHNPNSRKGGLIGLAATAIALGKVSTLYGSVSTRMMNHCVT